MTFTHGSAGKLLLFGSICSFSFYDKRTSEVELALFERVEVGEGAVD